ncbi:MAG: hypothetical protein F6K19_14970 [Cyanothece sp. SIO1E1]|nr:hypothetical protein [Cyanothece sp. SIO1E1]
MLTVRFYQFLTRPATRFSSPSVIFWFSLSLTFAFIYSFLGLQEAFASDYVVQDDARQHVFWIRQFLDPELFQDDLIAAYFRSLVPVGYTTVYRIFGLIGLDPIWVSKCLPMGLWLLTTAYCFGVCLQLFPVPAAAFSASLLLNQGLGLTDELVSATPKAFAYPLFLMFIYYLLRRSLWACLAAIALQGLFYPQMVFLSAGTLGCGMVAAWAAARPDWLSHRQNYIFSIIGLGVAFLVLLPYALKSTQFGPVISVAEAKQAPEFWSGGRMSFFVDDPAEFWLKGRSGLHLASILTPVTNALGFLLPILTWFPHQFPLIKQLTPKVSVLTQVALASLGMFCLSHLLLFRLHVPSRYTQHSWRMVMSLTAGIVLLTLIDAAWHWVARQRHQGRVNRVRAVGRSLLALAITCSLSIVLLLYPLFTSKFPITAYQVGLYPDLYEFFQKQPKDSLIASLAEEANNLPTFAQRSILVGREYGVPYHVGYYQQFRQRTVDLIRAQYSPDLAASQALVRQYGIDFWLLDQNAFTPNYLENPWIEQYQPITTEVSTSLAQGQTAALQTIADNCSVFTSGSLAVLSAKCILQASEP